MSSDGQETSARTASWIERSTRAKPPSSRPLFGYLLDLDDDLAAQLEVRMRFTARQDATARLLHADIGRCELSPWFALVEHGPGLLIVEGLIAVDTCVAGRTTTELLGSGDLLQPHTPLDDELVRWETAWRALSPTRLALLDAGFAQRMRSWPQILSALFRRAERRSDDLEVMRAISCHPRLEVRLVLALWHLAARWGRVEPSGFRLSLPLTHRLLGQLVGAERPSISHALHRLCEAGIVTGTAVNLHLHGSVEAHLESLTERPARPAVRERGTTAGAAALR